MSFTLRATRKHGFNHEGHFNSNRNSGLQVIEVFSTIDIAAMDQDIETVLRGTTRISYLNGFPIPEELQGVSIYALQVSTEG